MIHSLNSRVHGIHSIVIADTEQADNLYLIRAVEETVNNLMSVIKSDNGLINIISPLYQEIESINSNCKEMIEENIEEMLADAEESIGHRIDLMFAKQQCAKDDIQLNGHKEEAVIDAYYQAIESAKHLKEVICNLKWLVLEFNADHDRPEGKIYDSPEEFIADLRA